MRTTAANNGDAPLKKQIGEGLPYGLRVGSISRAYKFIDSHYGEKRGYDEYDGLADYLYLEGGGARIMVKNVDGWFVDIAEFAPSVPLRPPRHGDGHQNRSRRLFE
jgi:hypothetical protein